MEDKLEDNYNSDSKNLELIRKNTLDIKFVFENLLSVLDQHTKLMEEMLDELRR